MPGSRWPSGRIALKVCVACRAPVEIARSVDAKSAWESRGDAHPARDGSSDYFERTVKFGSDGHHTNAPARGLPKAFERLKPGRQKALGRVNAAASMADERSFEMNPERVGAAGKWSRGS